MRRRPTLPLKHNHGKSGHPGCQSSAPAVTRNPCFYDLDATCLSLLTYTNLMESICAALPARAACPCAELLGNRYWVPLRGDGSVMTLCLDVQIVADSPPVSSWRARRSEDEPVVIIIVLNCLGGARPENACVSCSLHSAYAHVDVSWLALAPQRVVEDQLIGTLSRIPGFARASANCRQTHAAPRKMFDSTDALCQLQDQIFAEAGVFRSTSWNSH